MVIRNFKKLVSTVAKRVNGDRKFKEVFEKNLKDNLFKGKQLMSYSITSKVVNGKQENKIELNWK